MLQWNWIVSVNAVKVKANILLHFRDFRVKGWEVAALVYLVITYEGVRSLADLTKTTMPQSVSLKKLVVENRMKCHKLTQSRVRKWKCCNPTSTYGCNKATKGEVLSMWTLYASQRGLMMKRKMNVDIMHTIVLKMYITKVQCVLIIWQHVGVLRKKVFLY